MKRRPLSIRIQADFKNDNIISILETYTNINRNLYLKVLSMNLDIQKIPNYFIAVDNNSYCIA